ncbi:MAG: VOC family protein [Paracoccaceae bacterium]
MFYSAAFGLTEDAKPESLKANGRIWFSNAGVSIHLGVGAEFKPAKKAHPALRVERLDTLTDWLETAGFDVLWDDRFPNTQRYYCEDPFGNRIKFMAL